MLEGGSCEALCDSGRPAEKHTTDPHPRTLTHASAGPSAASGFWKTQRAAADAWLQPPLVYYSPQMRERRERGSRRQFLELDRKFRDVRI